jgi:hypothetical protein
MTAVISAFGPGISESVRCMTRSDSEIVAPLRRLARRAPRAIALLAAERVVGPRPSASVTQMPSAFSTTSNQSPATS